MKQPATAKFISRHLYNFFVADEPQVPAWDILPPQNQDAIDGMVKVYLDSDGDADIVWANGDAFIAIDYRPLPTHGLQWLENKGNLEFDYLVTVYFI